MLGIVNFQSSIGFAAPSIYYDVLRIRHLCSLYYYEHDTNLKYKCTQVTIKIYI